MLPPQNPHQPPPQPLDWKGNCGFLHPPSSHKRALVVGCCYPNTKNRQCQTRGAVNDAHLMARFLTEEMGFRKKDIILLVDCFPSEAGLFEDPSFKDDISPMGDIHRLPTFDNIMKALQTLADTSSPGDQLFIYLSGTGVQVENMTGEENEGYFQAFLPCDYDTKNPGPYPDAEYYMTTNRRVLLMKTLREILSQKNRHAMATVFLDCAGAQSTMNFHAGKGAMGGAQKRAKGWHEFGSLLSGLWMQAESRPPDSDCLRRHNQWGAVEESVWTPAGESGWLYEFLPIAKRMSRTNEALKKEMGTPRHATAFALCERENKETALAVFRDDKDAPLMGRKNPRPISSAFCLSAGVWNQDALEMWLPEVDFLPFGAWGGRRKKTEDAGTEQKGWRTDEEEYGEKSKLLPGRIYGVHTWCFVAAMLRYKRELLKSSAARLSPFPLAVAPLTYLDVVMRMDAEVDRLRKFRFGGLTQRPHLTMEPLGHPLSADEQLFLQPLGVSAKERRLLLLRVQEELRTMGEARMGARVVKKKALEDVKCAPLGTFSPFDHTFPDREAHFFNKATATRERNRKSVGAAFARCRVNQLQSLSCFDTAAANALMMASRHEAHVNAAALARPHPGSFGGTRPGDVIRQTPVEGLSGRPTHLPTPSGGSLNNSSGSNGRDHTTTEWVVQLTPNRPVNNVMNSNSSALRGGLGMPPADVSPPGSPQQMSTSTTELQQRGREGGGEAAESAGKVLIQELSREWEHCVAAVKSKFDDEQNSIVPDEGPVVRTRLQLAN
uniref:Peptidase C14 caspase domain-containing protein n=1 Tax=Chromera velia CCMP2878 TaxID=1169474 RepID=A0A0G4HFG5_9ALVE|eukprot:Cvel_6649.t1-p1 / transcript=Cvel_6649.t1 / gene=Cvel_6649 / organism=Chromera_velia_CCMP2878 / gene_product=Metacaspase-1, putative / transcript_product=Metacaspase-1, putative / location=Cvel_scaffold330:10053-17129(-) / protein_length=777 / sequence_SO=supercontig / SO=protein_coding / is_pseudo=false